MPARTAQLAAGLLIFAWAACATADDGWPQWAGPGRDFAVSTKAAGGWSTAPTLIWSQEFGRGQSAVVADGSSLFTVRLGPDTGVTERRDAATGKVLWARRTPIEFHAPLDDYDGPHATPLLADGRLVTVSIEGLVQSRDAATGDLVWECDLRSVAGMRLPQSGYAASPLLWKDRIILPTVGNATGSESEQLDPDRTDGVPGAIALDAATGRELWRTDTFRCSHASPIAVAIDGQPTVVFHGMFELIGVEPSNGRVLWRQELRETASDNVSFTPIWDAERKQFLITHGYCEFGAQAVGVRRGNDGWRTRVDWTNPRLAAVHTNAVLVGLTLIGSGRSDVLTAIDVRDGETLSRQRGFGKANLIHSGRELLVLTEDGDLVGAELAESGVDERWRVSALGGKAWTVPTVADGRVYVRDTESLKAFRFGPPPAEGGDATPRR